MPQPLSLSKLILLAILFAASCKQHNGIGNWEVKYHATEGIPWLPFVWERNNISDRAAMMVPVRVAGFTQTCLFQFDLGSNITMLYGKPLGTLMKTNRAQPNSDTSALDDVTLSFGAVAAHAAQCYVLKNGGTIPSLEQGDRIQLGTIGADLFRDQVLIIDYPNNRFAVLKEIPAMFHGSWSSFTEDAGRVVLPMQYRRRSYKILFDNGSSIFPLLVDAKSIHHFSLDGGADTVTVPAWGKTYSFAGRSLKDSLKLAGKVYTGLKIYADTRPPSAGFDGIAGNALFWERVVVIDFRQKKFGVF
jgi:hypothetical protein